MPMNALLLLVSLILTNPSWQGESAVPTAQTDSKATRRVHVIVDRKSGVGGTVITEDETRLVIERDGKRTEFNKDLVIDVITLVEVTSPAPALVYLRDGGVRRVQLAADDFDEVRHVIGDTPRVIPREAVYRVVLIRPFDEQYKLLRESIDPDDHVRRLALCDWLVSQRKYSLAEQELVPLVEASKLPEAVALLKRVRSQLKLDAGRAAAATRRADADVKKETKDASPAFDMSGLRLLSDAEINLIRVYEIDFDRPPRIAIAPADARQLFADHASNPRVPPDAAEQTALAEGDPLRLVRLAFDLKARDFYPRIRVLTEPESMLRFRRDVHDSWLIPNCATSGCHGGPDGGSLFLHRGERGDMQVATTNMLHILLGRTGDRPLLDFSDAARSPLLQYALPSDETATPHPPVKGWKPAFGKRVNEAKFAASVAWIRSLYQPRPTYPVDYEPPDFRLPPPGSNADQDEPSR
ncbi:MAG: hypothetical protein ACKO4V_01975 [Planctomycetota bacterium]